MAGPGGLSECPNDNHKIGGSQQWQDILSAGVLQRPVPEFAEATEKPLKTSQRKSTRTNTLRQIAAEGAKDLQLGVVPSNFRFADHYGERLPIDFM